MIGVFSDSDGDLGAFDAAYELLREKGAKRFFFLGGRYTDLDEWLQQKRTQARGGREYSDADFLTDISNYLVTKEQVERPSAFGDGAEDLGRLPEQFLRAPERDCPHYRDPNVPNKVVDMIGNALCCLVHDKNDLSKEDLLNGVLFLHGKESEPKVVQIGVRFFLTPGRLTGAAEQTCGLLDVAGKNLCYSAFCLDGRTIIERELLVLGSKAKVLVK